jgi:hypothetical protein
MDKELRFDFSGTDIPRDNYLEDIKNRLFPFVNNKIHYWNVFSMMIIEMLKNIYDHAGGNGYALFIKSNETISFQIKSFSSEEFDYLLWSEPGKSSKDTKYNRGIGLSIIEGTAEQLEIDLKIEQSEGLLYKGVWVYKR